MRTRRARRPLVLLVCVIPLAAISLAATADAAKPAKKKAHLTVTSVRPAPGQAKPLHRFAEGKGVEYRVTVRNDGDGPTGKLLHARLDSKDSGALAFRDENNFEMDWIKAGDKTTFPVTAFGSGGSKPTTVSIRVCVSVRGLNKTEGVPLSCRGGPGFAVIAKAYDGSASARQPVFGYGRVESLADPRFTYDANASAREGKFVYTATGQLVHTISGSNGFCSISGSGSGSFARNETKLALDPDLLAYSGSISHPQIVNATQVCYGISSPAPVRTGGITIGPKSRAPLDEGDPLAGTSNGLFGLTFEWRLVPE
jgi:hypothetical protein